MYMQPPNSPKRTKSSPFMGTRGIPKWRIRHSFCIIFAGFGGGTNGRTPRGVRRYHCSFCNYSTIYKQTLQRHHRTHTGERPFECEYCLKTFAQKCNMKSHMRLHTGECPYKCQFCHASFRQRHLLTSHLQEEHAVRLAFKCGYCASGFLTKHELWRHMKSCINDWNP